MVCNINICEKLIHVRGKAKSPSFLKELLGKKILRNFLLLRVEWSENGLVIEPRKQHVRGRRSS